MRPVSKIVKPDLIDICTFADEFASNYFKMPDGVTPSKLFPHQRTILNGGLGLKDGKLKWKTFVYSCSKKSGKTAIGSLIVAWFAYILCPDNDEILVIANDLEQAQARVFQGFIDLVRSDPGLYSMTDNITNKQVTTKRGVRVKCIANDYAGVAGANFSLATYDELWASTSEAQRRLYEETTPVPTRQNCIRVITTYAGFYGESELLWDLYDRAVLQGTKIDDELNIYVNEKSKIYAYWDEQPRMPWHTEEYLLEQEHQPGMRDNAFKRLFYNQWTSGEEGITMSEWDTAVDLGIENDWDYLKASTPNKKLYLSVGIDASVKRDRAAVVSCFKKGDKIWLGPRKYWQPSMEDPLDFEKTIEEFVRWLNKYFVIYSVLYDPYQFVRSAQTLWKAGIPMQEFTQTIPHGCEMGNHLLDLLRNKNIVLYPDSELRKEAQQVSLVEVPGRGYRIDKTKQNKKIDSIIALAMAALSAEKLPSSDDSFGNSLLILRK